MLWSGNHTQWTNIHIGGNIWMMVFMCKIGVVVKVKWKGNDQSSLYLQASDCKALLE